MTDPAASDTLRIGDREREQAVALLHDAVGRGYLDLGEFEERSRAVYAARTRGDLRPVLIDLPTAAALVAPPAGGPAVAARPDTVDIDWTTVKRRGRWEVPAHLIIAGSMGNADLDLREAAVPAGGCIIEVQASWSTVKIRLGSSIAARADGFQGGSMSTFKDKAGPPPVPGGPIVELRGRPNWTSVIVRR